jgi:hypothetical protein
LRTSFHYSLNLKAFVSFPATVSTTRSIQIASLNRRHRALLAPINCSNFSLDHTLDPKVGGFTSSCIQRSVLLRPIQTETLDFGSTLCEMAIGHAPYSDLSKAQMEKVILERHHPDLRNMETFKIIDSTMLECEHNGMADILEDVHKYRPCSEPHSSKSPTLILK